ncbi:hypothetical protein ACKLNO_03530 [Neisseriaceae bacterium B1]
MFTQIKIATYLIATLLLSGILISHHQRGNAIAKLQQQLIQTQTERDNQAAQLKQAQIAQAQLHIHLSQWQQQAQANQRSLETALQNEPQWANQKLPENIKKAIQP